MMMRRNASLSSPSSWHRPSVTLRALPLPGSRLGTYLHFIHWILMGVIFSGTDMIRWQSIIGVSHLMCRLTIDMFSIDIFIFIDLVVMTSPPFPNPKPPRPKLILSLLLLLQSPFTNIMPHPLNNHYTLYLCFTIKIKKHATRECIFVNIPSASISFLVCTWGWFFFRVAMLGGKDYYCLPQGLPRQ